MYESLSSQTIKLPMTFPMITDILGPVTAILSVLGTILFFVCFMFFIGAILLNYLIVVINKFYTFCLLFT